MVKCVFCGKEEHSFKGIHYIKNDGTVNFFCSSKCRKNTLKLKRDRKKLKWTTAYREQKAHLIQRAEKIEQKAAALVAEKAAKIAKKE